ncbi:hypothetical protein N7532_007010 [Penicillium argentinense]|uniref:Uncharacterized protein n=1 Tax=Penicillium argentinense TaxID=1131581 RepID=A0A9W9FH21_9EURO|nr:uncharacterized protein N7532_007010 [Penicillium argentinense]KAJ5100009.1 hypothetical protein N7532_007010 [Penicillium argentinense]
MYEPGRGPDNGMIGFCCDALERIAANDAGFAAIYGTRFHRFQVPATPTSGYRSRRRGPNVPSNPIPFPGFGPAASAAPSGTASGQLPPESVTRTGDDSAEDGEKSSEAFEPL